MAVPKSKITRMKRGHRRSTDALKNPTYVEDKNSGELRRPHHIDLKSGMYRGRPLLPPPSSFFFPLLSLFFLFHLFSPVKSWIVGVIPH